MRVRVRTFVFSIIVACFAVVAFAQDQEPVEKVPVDRSAPQPKNNVGAPPRDDNVPAGESSSKQTEIDITPPANDEKLHPEANLGDTGVDEFTPYNPMKAIKDVEVGDFYAKQENYDAAISRYREALEFKPHDAEATFKLAQVLSKIGNNAEAMENYQEYLKMLPHGPYAKKAQEELDKLKKKPVANAKPSNKPKTDIWGVPVR